MDCPYCYAYVYDQLSRPAPHHHTFLFEMLINLKRGLRDKHAFVRPFMRAITDPKEVGHIAILFVEAGGVTRPKRMKLDCPLPIARLWAEQKLRDIGDLDQLHFIHIHGVQPEPPPPPPSKTGLSIRIPKRRNSIS
jgi:hypothetical protein